MLKVFKQHEQAKVASVDLHVLYNLLQDCGPDDSVVRLRTRAKSSAEINFSMDKITHFEENHGGGGEMHESRSTALTSRSPRRTFHCYRSILCFVGRQYRAKFNFGK